MLRLSEEQAAALAGVTPKRSDQPENSPKAIPD
jgi:hypothetical protein